MWRILRNWLIFFGLAALLAACGSSGSSDDDSDSTPATPPGTADVAITVTPSSGSLPLTATLDASATELDYGGRVIYSWSATLDGEEVGTATGKKTSMVFTAIGTYVIDLTVKDTTESANVVGAGQAVVTVTDTPTSLNAEFEVTPDPDDPMTVHLDATGSSTSAGNSVIDYDWTVTDSEGATVAPTLLLTSELGATAKMTFATPGTYTVTLTIYDDSGTGQSATTSQQVQVPTSSEDLSASFTILDADGQSAISTGEVPITLTLDASATTEGNQLSISSYAWSVVDSEENEVQAASGKVATVALTTADTYIVTLTVTDSEGRTAVAHRAFEATAPETEE